MRVAATRPDHIVQFYEDDAFLFEAAGAFLAAGVHAEQAAVIIATAPHREGLVRSLAARGLDVEQRERTGQITLIDARELLATFMAGSMPDEARFQESVGGLIRNTLQRTGRTSVRAYGEMVDVLWQEGRTDAAIRLEELWHDLGNAQPLSLLCAYSMANFYNQPSGAGLAEVSSLHTHALPPPGGTHVPVLAPTSDTLQAELEHRRQLETALRDALTARRHAETALREREEELRDFLENAVEGLHWVGPDGTILWANQAELDLLGYTRDEYIGHHVAEFHADRDVIAAMLDQLARGDAICNREARLRRKDGAIRHVLISSNVFWKNGRFVHTRCFTRDITPQKHAALARHRIERHLRAQYAVTRVLAEANTLSDATPRILRAVCESAEWQLGAIWGVDEAQRTIRCIDLWHVADIDVQEFAAETRRSAFPSGVGLPGRVWASGAPVWIPDVVTDSNFPRAPYAQRGGLHGAFGFPIRSRDRITGVIECFSSEVRHPDEELLQLFDAVGVQIGQFVERRQSEDTRERAARAAQFLADASTALAQVADYRSTLERIAQLAVPTFADWCTVDIVDDAGALERLAVTHTDPEKVALAYEVQRRWPQRPDAPHGPAAVVRTGRSEVMSEIPDRVLAGAAQSEEHLQILRTLGLVSFMSVPIRSEQKIYGVLTFVTAESGRRYDERDLQTAEDLGRRAAVAIENVVLYEELERSVRARDEFLSVAGHELRNPLNALQLQLVGLLRATRQPREPLTTALISHRIGEAVEDLERLVHLVHNLLDMTRITAGRLDLEPEEVDLSAIVHTVADRLRPQAADGQLTLALEPVIGWWDRLRLEQIATNLLSNAIKFGGGKPIDVTLAAEPEAITLTVADRGIGIDPDRQKTLFDRFERGVSRRDYGGFGLGLWITRNIVQAMGGHISVDSRVGAGSTFRVRLPRTARP